MDDEQYKIACQHAIDRGNIRVTYYRRGAIVTGWPPRWPSHCGEVIQKRGIIRSATIRTLIRAGFAVSNAPVDFDLMTTLTFRERPERAKDALRQWCSDPSIRPGLGTHWGWVQEYQERGVVHYHVLHSQEALQGHWGDEADCWETVGRRPRQRLVLRGLAESDIATRWMAATGDNSLAAHRYNFGGICEKIRSPAAMGAYLGHYLAKLGQKSLPEGEPPQGRWWWLSRACAAVPCGEGTVISWEAKRAHRLVFDKRKIDSIEDNQPTVGSDDKDILPNVAIS